MARYLRIRNRRPCLRDVFRFIGFTDKRDDDSRDGFFGSGAKYAGIAALNLGIDVWVASHDAAGPYLFRYETREIAFGPLKRNQVVMAFDEGEVVETSFLDDACPNWTKPIDDDTMRAVRVLGEFYQNAFDAEPLFPWGYCDAPERSPKGETHVFIALHDDIRHMLTHPERYLKKLSKQRALYTAVETSVVEGRIDKRRIGTVYPKSEEGMTRLFSRGRLAYCNQFLFSQSVFDYSFERKDLLSEDRTFSSDSGFRRELCLLLANLEDTDLAAAILRKALAGQAGPETSAMDYLDVSEEIPAEAVWRDAWKRLQQDAVISSGEQPDEIVIRVVKRGVVKVMSPNLKDFLLRCGVPDAMTILPKGTDQNGWKEAPISIAGRRRLAVVQAALLQEFPDMADVPIRSFIPFKGTAADAFAGFVPRAEDGSLRREVFVKYDQFYTNRRLTRVLQHEYRHIRSQANDATRAFEWVADEDITILLMEKYDIPDDTPEPKKG